MGNPFQRVYNPLYAAKSHRFAFEFFIFPYLSLHMPCKLERNLENWKTDLSKKSAHSPKRVGGLCNLEQIEFVKQLLSNSHATLNFTDVFSSRSGHTGNGIVVASTIAVVVTYNLTA